MARTVKQDKKQRILIWTVIALMSFNPVVSFVNTVTNLYISQGSIYDTVLVYSILLLLIVRVLIIIIPIVKKELVITFLVLLMIIAFTGFISPENYHASFTELIDFMSNPLYYFLFSIIGYFTIRHIKSIEEFTSTLFIYSIIVVAISILNYFLLFTNGYTAEYMVVSYDALFFVVFSLLMSIQKKQILYLFFGLVGVVFIFTIGARGALISLLLSFFVYFIFKKQKLIAKVAVSFGFLVVFFMMYNNLDVYLRLFGRQLDSLEIQSKIIGSYLDNSFLYDSGRSQLQSLLFKNVSPFGKGIFGDRVILEGGYAHNIFVEIIYQWGYFIGLSLFFLLLFKFVQVLRNSNRLQLILIASFLSVGFFKLFFSGSYLTEVNFGLLLGVCFNRDFFFIEKSKDRVSKEFSYEGVMAS